MKVAIIHYWFITRRGGEKVVESILKLYPNADVYTLFYDKAKYGDHLKNYRVFTSKYNTPFFRKHYQKLFPIYPKIVKSLELQEDYDLIISSESGPAKGVKINNIATHVCYIHSPMRYCWGYTDQYLMSLNPIIKPIARFFFRKLRKWDKTTINNVDFYIANSINVAKRVERFYNRKSQVIYPPINPDLFEKPLLENKRTHFLSFGAITPYKKIDLLVDCFNDNGDKLIIIGEGSEKKKLIQKSHKNIEFLGFVSDQELTKYISNSRALLFPGEEDFGMIPLEVMANGIPVIAYKKGGALETVVESQKPNESTGIFFKDQSKDSINEAINRFKKIENKFDPKFIRRHAKKFEENLFLHRFEKSIRKLIQ